MPKLPFVIATTGMGGGQIYTELERAQLSIADANAYPEFAGNVAVIDTRVPCDGLTFREEEEWSPAAQGFHWNRNARTSIHIGLAMADAMSIMTPGRCPFRLRGTGGPDGVMLGWQNGTETPASVRILRNGTEIAAAAFLQRLARSAGIGGTWKVIGSSGSVDARDHTSTNPDKDGPGAAVFLLDGTTKVADTSIDLWNGGLDAAVNRDERGHADLSGSVYTGTELNGTKRHRPLGGSDEANPRVTTGEMGKRDRWWLVKYNASTTSALPVYALSDPLTVKSVEKESK